MLSVVELSVLVEGDLRRALSKAGRDIATSVNRRYRCRYLSDGTEEHAMRYPKFVQTMICIALLGVVSSANAQTQDDRWRRDLKPLIPPVVPLPPNSQLNPGTVGGASNPYTTAPLQTPSTQAPTQPAPGLRLTIPSR
jgi:hypothetical protein